RHRAARGDGVRAASRRHRGSGLHVGARAWEGQPHRAAQELGRAWGGAGHPGARPRAAAANGRGWKREGPAVLVVVGGLAGGRGVRRGRGGGALQRWLILATVAALAGSFLVSYVRARAQSLGFTCETGIFARPERVVVMVVGLILGGWVLYAVVFLLAVLTNLTALQRIRE